MSKGRAITFAVLTTVLTVAVLWSPGRYGPSSCMSKRMLRVSCPGCGLTRSVTAAAQLDFPASVKFHAMGPLFLAFGVVIWALLGAGLVLGRDLLPDFGRPVWGWALGITFATLIAYWLYRFFTRTLPP